MDLLLQFIKNRPKGISGPSSKDHSQGWIRNYNVRGNYNATSLFSSHNLDGSGTIIGFDKYYDNILIGIAAGSASSKSYVDSAYASDTDMVNGSIYSTIGGRKSILT